MLKIDVNPIEEPNPEVLENFKQLGNQSSIFKDGDLKPTQDYGKIFSSILRKDSWLLANLDIERALIDNAYASQIYSTILEKAKNPGNLEMHAVDASPFMLIDEIKKSLIDHLRLSLYRSYARAVCAHHPVAYPKVLDEEISPVPTIVGIGILSNYAMLESLFESDPASCGEVLAVLTKILSGLGPLALKKTNPDFDTPLRKLQKILIKISQEEQKDAASGDELGSILSLALTRGSSASTIIAISSLLTSQKSIAVPGIVRDLLQISSQRAKLLPIPGNQRYSFKFSDDPSVSASLDEKEFVNLGSKYIQADHNSTTSNNEHIFHYNPATKAIYQIETGYGQGSKFGKLVRTIPIKTLEGINVGVRSQVWLACVQSVLYVRSSSDSHIHCYSSSDPSSYLGYIKKDGRGTFVTQAITTKALGNTTEFNGPIYSDERYLYAVEIENVGKADEELYSFLLHKYDPLKKFGLVSSTSICGKPLSGIKGGGITKAKYFASGQNNCYQLGLGDATIRRETTENNPEKYPKDAGVINKIFGGSDNTWIVNTNGVAYGVGKGSNGQFGVGNYNHQQAFVKIKVPHPVKMIAAGNNSSHVLLLTTNGWVFGSGYNGSYQLGLNDTQQRNKFTRVKDVDNLNFVHISAEGNHSAALTDTGLVYAWGQNSQYNSMCLRQNGNVQKPKLSDDLKQKGKVTYFQMGYNFSWFLMESGELYSIGENGNGQLGIGNTTSKNKLQKVKGLPEIETFDTGYVHGMVIGKDGSVWGWGSNSNAQCGFPTNKYTINKPTCLKNPDGFGTPIQVACGTYFSCVLDDNGTGWGTGCATSGQLGSLTGSVIGLTNFFDKVPLQYLACGNNHVVMLPSKPMDPFTVQTLKTMHFYGTDKVFSCHVPGEVGLPGAPRDPLIVEDEKTKEKKKILPAYHRTFAYRGSFLTYQSDTELRSKTEVYPFNFLGATYSSNKSCIYAVTNTQSTSEHPEVVKGLTVNQYYSPNRNLSSGKYWDAATLLNDPRFKISGSGKVGAQQVGVNLLASIELLQDTHLLLSNKNEYNAEKANLLQEAKDEQEKQKKMGKKKLYNFERANLFARSLCIGDGNLSEFLEMNAFLDILFKSFSEDIKLQTTEAYSRVFSIISILKLMSKNCSFLISATKTNQLKALSPDFPSYLARFTNNSTKKYKSSISGSAAGNSAELERLFTGLNNTLAGMLEGIASIKPETPEGKDAIKLIHDYGGQVMSTAIPLLAPTYQMKAKFLYNGLAGKTLSSNLSMVISYIKYFQKEIPEQLFRVICNAGVPLYKASDSWKVNSFDQEGYEFKVMDRCFQLILSYQSKEDIDISSSEYQAMSSLVDFIVQAQSSLILYSLYSFQRGGSNERKGMMFSNIVSYSKHLFRYAEAEAGLVCEMANQLNGLNSLNVRDSILSGQSPILRRIVPNFLCSARKLIDNTALAELLLEDLSTLASSVDEVVKMFSTLQPQSDSEELSEFSCVLDTTHPYTTSKQTQITKYIQFPEDVYCMSVSFDERSSTMKKDKLHIYTNKTLGNSFFSVSGTRPDDWSGELTIPGNSFVMSFSFNKAKKDKVDLDALWGYKAYVHGFKKPKASFADHWCVTLQKSVSTVVAESCTKTIVSTSGNFSLIPERFQKSNLFSRGFRSLEESKVSDFSEFTHDFITKKDQTTPKLFKIFSTDYAPADPNKASIKGSALESGKPIAGVQCNFVVTPVTSEGSAPNPIFANNISLQVAPAVDLLCETSKSVPSWDAEADMTVEMGKPLKYALSQVSGCLATNGKMYLFGGYTRWGTDNDYIYCYDPKSKSDTINALKGRMPRPSRGGAAVALSNGNILVFGGTKSKFIGEFVPDTGKWILTHRMPQDLKGGFGWGVRAVIDSSDMVHVCGGEGAMDRYYTYDYKRKAWRKRTNIPVSIKCHGISINKDGIFLFGGASNAADKCLLNYKFRTSAWTNLTNKAPLPQPVTQFQFCQSNGIGQRGFGKDFGRYIVLIGGSSKWANNKAPIYKHIRVLDTHNILKGWKSAKTTLKVGLRESFSIMDLDGKIHLFGGSDGKRVAHHYIITSNSMDRIQADKPKKVDIPIELRNSICNLKLDKIDEIEEKGQPKHYRCHLTYPASGFYHIQVLLNGKVIPGSTTKKLEVLNPSKLTGRAKDLLIEARKQQEEKRKAEIEKQKQKNPSPEKPTLTRKLTASFKSWFGGKEDKPAPTPEVELPERKSDEEWLTTLKSIAPGYDRRIYDHAYVTIANKDIKRAALWMVTHAFEFDTNQPEKQFSEISVDSPVVDMFGDVSVEDVPEQKDIPIDGVSAKYRYNDLEIPSTFDVPQPVSSQSQQILAIYAYLLLLRHMECKDKEFRTSLRDAFMDLVDVRATDTKIQQMIENTKLGRLLLKMWTYTSSQVTMLFSNQFDTFKEVMNAPSGPPASSVPIPSGEVPRQFSSEHENSPMFNLFHGIGDVVKKPGKIKKKKRSRKKPGRGGLLQSIRSFKSDEVVITSSSIQAQPSPYDVPRPKKQSSEDLVDVITKSAKLLVEFLSVDEYNSFYEARKEELGPILPGLAVGLLRLPSLSLQRQHSFGEAFSGDHEKAPLVESKEQQDYPDEVVEWENEPWCNDLFYYLISGAVSDMPEYGYVKSHVEKARENALKKASGYGKLFELLFSTSNHSVQYDLIWYLSSLTSVHHKHFTDGVSGCGPSALAELTRNFSALYSHLVTVLNDTHTPDKLKLLITKSWKLTLTSTDKEFLVQSRIFQGLKKVMTNRDEYDKTKEDYVRKQIEFEKEKNQVMLKLEKSNSEIDEKKKEIDQKRAKERENLDPSSAVNWKIWDRVSHKQWVSKNVGFAVWVDAEFLLNKKKIFCTAQVIEESVKQFLLKPKNPDTYGLPNSPVWLNKEDFMKFYPENTKTKESQDAPEDKDWIAQYEGIKQIWKADPAENLSDELKFVAEKGDRIVITEPCDILQHSNDVVHFKLSSSNGRAPLLVDNDEESFWESNSNEGQVENYYNRRHVAHWIECRFPARARLSHISMYFLPSSDRNFIPASFVLKALNPYNKSWDVIGSYAPKIVDGYNILPVSNIAKKSKKKAYFEDGYFCAKVFRIEIPEVLNNQFEVRVRQIRLFTADQPVAVQELLGNKLLLRQSAMETFGYLASSCFAAFKSDSVSISSPEDSGLKFSIASLMGQASKTLTNKGRKIDKVQELILDVAFSELRRYVQLTMMKKPYKQENKKFIQLVSMYDQWTYGDNLLSNAEKSDSYALELVCMLLSITHDPVGISILRRYPVLKLLLDLTIVATPRVQLASADILSRILPHFSPSVDQKNNEQVVLKQKKQKEILGTLLNLFSSHYEMSYSSKVLGKIYKTVGSRLTIPVSGFPENEGCRSGILTENALNQIKYGTDKIFNEIKDENTYCSSYVYRLYSSTSDLTPAQQREEKASELKQFQTLLNVHKEWSELLREEWLKTLTQIDSSVEDILETCQSSPSKGPSNHLFWRTLGFLTVVPPKKLISILYQSKLLKNDVIKGYFYLEEDRLCYLDPKQASALTDNYYEYEMKCKKQKTTPKTLSEFGATYIDKNHIVPRIKLFTDSKRAVGRIEISQPADNCCRFCGTKLEKEAKTQVCTDEDCVEKLANVCTKVHKCGHPCNGVLNEKKHLPCLNAVCLKKFHPNIKQKGSDICAACYTEELECGPCLQLKCGHIFHAECMESLMLAKWSGVRISFKFLQCPVCNDPITDLIPSLEKIHKPLLDMKKKVESMAKLRLEFEKKTKDKMITDPKSPYYQKPIEYALKLFAYFQCYECKEPYYGGGVDCAANRDQFDIKELVCSKCSGVGMAQSCPKHGTANLSFKCRFCCKIAIWFCFGTTHFCDPCHNNHDKLCRTKPEDLPKCPGPEKCPLGIKHPPHGEEFALGCSLCAGANEF